MPTDHSDGRRISAQNERRASSRELGDGLVGLSSDPLRNGRDSGRAVWASELEVTNGLTVCEAHADRR